MIFSVSLSRQEEVVKDDIVPASEVPCMHLFSITVMSIEMRYEDTQKLFDGCDISDINNPRRPYVEFIDKYNATHRFCHHTSNYSFDSSSDEMTGKFYSSGDFNIVPFIKFVTTMYSQCCGGTFYDSEGSGLTILERMATSPGFPDAYPPESRCSFRFICKDKPGTTGCRMSVIYPDFHLGRRNNFLANLFLKGPHPLKKRQTLSAPNVCGHEDQVRITNCNVVNEGYTENLCNKIAPSKTYYAEKEILMYFSSNAKVEDKGFSLIYTALRPASIYTDIELNAKCHCGRGIPPQVREAALKSNLEITQKFRRNRRDLIENASRHPELRKERSADSHFPQAIKYPYRRPLKGVNNVLKSLHSEKVVEKGLKKSGNAAETDHQPVDSPIIRRFLRKKQEVRQNLPRRRLARADGGRTSTTTDQSELKANGEETKSGEGKKRKRKRLKKDRRRKTEKKALKRKRKELRRKQMKIQRPNVLISKGTKQKERKDFPWEVIVGLHPLERNPKKSKEDKGKSGMKAKVAGGQKNEVRKKDNDKNKIRGKTNLLRQCVGTLISDRHVLTTTSCCTYCAYIWAKKYRRKQYPELEISQKKQRKIKVKKRRKMKKTKREKATQKKRQQVKEENGRKPLTKKQGNLQGEPEESSNGGKKKRMTKKKRNTLKRERKEEKKKQDKLRKKWMKPRMKDIVLYIGLKVFQKKIMKKTAPRRVKIIYIPNECYELMSDKEYKYPVHCPVVLELKKVVEFTDEIAPMCLPVFETFNHEKELGNSLGRGYKKASSKKNSNTPQVLVEIRPLDAGVCQQAVGSLHETQFCTQKPDSNSMCFGDEGAPYFFYRGNSTQYEEHLTLYALLVRPGCPKEGRQLLKNKKSVKKRRKYKLVKRQGAKKASKRDSAVGRTTTSKPRKKNKNKKGRNPNKKYGKLETNGNHIDVWVEVGTYANWILDKVFKKDENMICQRKPLEDNENTIENNFEVTCPNEDIILTNRHMGNGYRH